LTSSGCLPLQCAGLLRLLLRELGWSKFLTPMGCMHLGSISLFLASTLVIGRSRFAFFTLLARWTFVLAWVRAKPCLMPERCKPVVLHLRGHLFLVRVLESDVLIFVF
jgi:hypothetical protein